MPAAQFPVTGGGACAEARDYLVGSTYRKEMLHGALWQRLHRQLRGQGSEAPVPSPRPDLGVRRCRGLALEGGRRPPQAGATARDARSVLSAVLGFSLGALRWEPVNPNAEHRPCPSPGGRFTIDAALSVAGRGGTATYRYHPRHHKLVAVEDPRDLTLAPASVAISLSSDLSRCASPYGDLAYCLSAIEAGAVLAQLTLMLGEFDLRAERVEFLRSEPDAGPVSGLTLHLTAPAIADWLRQTPTVDLAVLEETYPPLERARHPLLGALLDRSAAGGAPDDAFPGGLSAAWPADAAATLREATAARSSGLDMMAGPGVNRPPSSRDMRVILETAAAIHGSFWGLERHGVRLDVVVPEGAGLDASADWRLGPGSSLSVGTLASGRDVAWGHIHPPGAMIATVSADYRVYCDRFGVLALFNMYLAAGIVAQIVCLASAGAGLVCRPMRSFDHAAADALLPIDQWSVLQLVIYAERASNLAFPVGQAS